MAASEWKWLNVVVSRNVPTILDEGARDGRGTGAPVAASTGFVGRSHARPARRIAALTASAASAPLAKKPSTRSRPSWTLDSNSMMQCARLLSHNLALHETRVHETNVRSARLYGAQIRMITRDANQLE